MLQRVTFVGVVGVSSNRSQAHEAIRDHHCLHTSAAGYTIAPITLRVNLVAKIYAMRAGSAVCCKQPEYERRYKAACQTRGGDRELWDVDVDIVRGNELLWRSLLQHILYCLLL